MEQGVTAGAGCLCNFIPLHGDNRQTVTSLSDITHNYSCGSLPPVRYYSYCSYSWVSDTLPSDAFCVQTVLLLENINKCVFYQCVCVCGCVCVHVCVSLTPAPLSSSSSSSLSVLIFTWPMTPSLLVFCLIFLPSSPLPPSLLSIFSSTAGSWSIRCCVVCCPWHPRNQEASAFYFNRLAAEYQANYQPPPPPIPVLSMWTHSW